MQRLLSFIGLVVYLVMARASLTYAPKALGRALFALLNIAGVAYFWHWTTGARPVEVLVKISIYVSLVLVHFVLLRSMHRAPEKPAWPAILYPVVVLVAFKYTQPLWAPTVTSHGVTIEQVERQFLSIFVGLSYMAFRLSYLAVEVRNRVVTMPTVWEYLGFAFFVPTIPVGPISPGSVFFASMDAPSAEATPISRSLLRILVGATKYLVVAAPLGHLTYIDLLNDGNPHLGFIDPVVSAVAYYLYLYCNFSGFCDMAIGVAGLIGISVIENFNDPLLSRNIKDFWSRWHISLSSYVREMLFSPLSKYLAGKMSPESTNHAIAVALMVTFIATGVWHGAGLNFFLFGLLHGSATVAHHYYTLFLRKRLTRDQLKRYNASMPIRVVAVTLTFSFVTATFFVFANDLPTILRLLHLREG